MDRWPQRQAFLKHLADYRERTGESVAKVAERLGVSEHSVYSYMSRPKSVPSEETKRAAAELFGCSITEFADDPNPSSSPFVGWPDVSEMRRAVAQGMFSDIRAEDLTDEEVMELYRAWKEALDRWRRMKKGLGSGGMGIL